MKLNRFGSASAYALETSDNRVIYISYNTPVALYNGNDGTFVSTSEKWSATTSKQTSVYFMRDAFKRGREAGIEVKVLDRKPQAFFDSLVEVRTWDHFTYSSREIVGVAK